MKIVLYVSKPTPNPTPNPTLNPKTNPNVTNPNPNPNPNPFPNPILSNNSSKPKKYNLLLSQLKYACAEGSASYFFLVLKS